jgi:hypothetical protein
LPSQADRAAACRNETDHQIRAAAAGGRRGGRVGNPVRFAGPLKYLARSLKDDLSIIQWRHVVFDYNLWFDAWATSWGEKNDIQVSVDHVDYRRLPALATAEALPNGVTTSSGSCLRRPRSRTS